MILTHNITVESGRPLLSVLRHEMELSAAMVKRLKHSNGIFINGMPVYTNHIVSTGEIVTADISSAELPSNIVPEIGEINILYETPFFIALNKPPGIPVHPTRSKYTDTLANYVAGYLLEHDGSACCHAVNRLDRDTSGVVLFAKNSHMKDRLSRALRRDDAVKEYVGIVYGSFSEPAGVIDLPIKRLREMDMIRVVAEDGQAAVTHYETVKAENVGEVLISLVKFRLMTGRTHQIRVHCFSHGHPLLGDTLYYTEESRTASAGLGLDVQALHAQTLAFIEPVSKERMEINAPIIRDDIKKVNRILFPKV